jgi:hypothetical protein
MGTDEEIEVTESDHEAGFKEIPIFYKAAGKTGRLRLFAPGHRVMLQVYTAWQTTGDASSVVAACRPELTDKEEPKPWTPQIDAHLAKLTLVSAGQVQTVCIALAFGDEVLKKNRETGMHILKLLLAQATISERPNRSASAPATAPET